MEEVKEEKPEDHAGSAQEQQGNSGIKEKAEMKKKELLKRIEELEKRVLLLEQYLTSTATTGLPYLDKSFTWWEMQPICGDVVIKTTSGTTTQ